MRAVIYARYSSDLQSEASIADQVEVCRRYAAERGWDVVEPYADAAISGVSRFRPGFQKLLMDAGSKKFDTVLCEAVDRLGRRLADTADLQDRLAFYGVKLFTPTLGEITTIHVAVMGMMAQMALKDLAEKTRRGQLGRVLKGKSAGGLAYGYRIPPATPGAGEREVDPAQAIIVQRIFREFAAGDSPELIARRLNRQGVAGPGGRPWSNTTIRGQNARGTGLLNNALYRGTLEWNRCAYVKDPQTGKRVARPNPPHLWEKKDVAHLRIVDDALWAAAKSRQDAMRDAFFRKTPLPDSNPLNATHRARFLLSGLLRCGCCSGAYTIVGKDRYGCATRRIKGTCDNSRTITRQEIEARVLVGLKQRLLAPELVAEFVNGVQEELAAQRNARKATEIGRAKRIADVERRIAGIIQAIEDGLYDSSMKARLKDLQAERQTLEAERADEAGSSDDLAVLSHPSLPQIYRRKIEHLETVLDGPERTEAMNLIRSMIDHIELRPSRGKSLDAILHGDLAAILSVSQAAKNENALGRGAAGRQLSVVAGARFELTTFRL